jgi:hypothetical protein
MGLLFVEQKIVSVFCRKESESQCHALGHVQVIIMIIRIMKITGSASVLPSSERYEEIPLHNRLQHDVASSTSPGKNRMELEYDVIGGGRLSRSEWQKNSNLFRPSVHPGLFLLFN